MHIGVDFDNTIVCYDALFHKVAREKHLIPADVPVNKSEVRNYLRRAGKEDAWTEMQGYVYGARMAEATPYPGALDFLHACRAAGVPISIISHKTKHPFLGEKYDLHAAATNWLEQQGFFDPARIGLPRENVFFELTKETKLERIGRCGCTHFIDDLPEFLAEPAFPTTALRMLFDANNLYAEESRFVRAQDWGEIRELFAADLRIPTEASALRDKVEPLLRQQGVRAGWLLQPLPGGANNRVYRLRSEGADHVLKVYFQNPNDPRDRFRAERAFYDHLWRIGVRRTPEPCGWEEQNRFGLLSFVAGRKLRPEEVNEDAVNQALDFIQEVNQARASVPADCIPVAAEACFSIAEHVALVDRRVARLQQIGAHTELDARAAAFVQDELNPAWGKVRPAAMAGDGNHPESTLPRSHRCLSPSDFGFHNALLATDGWLRFFDFEYAGWDDPAKLVCDFFCQPQIPVSAVHWEGFVGRLDAAWKLGGELAIRARRLLPVYRIKWCCIVLNEFLGTDQARREFALGAGATAEKKRMQLERARALLSQVH
jgi:hypothetical protein